MALLDAETASCAGRTLKALKTFLLTAFMPSKWQRAQRMLDVTDSGDHQALQVADYLLHTLSDLDPVVILQYVFLRCLLPHIKTTLAYSKATDSEKLAEEVDWILEFPRPAGPLSLATQQTSQLCSLSMFPAPPYPAYLEDEDPSDGPAKLHRLGHCGRHAFPQDCPCNRCPSDGLHYIHLCFSPSAPQCRQPCAWHLGNGAMPTWQW